MLWFRKIHFPAQSWHSRGPSDCFFSRTLSTYVASLGLQYLWTCGKSYAPQASWFPPHRFLERATGRNLDVYRKTYVCVYVSIYISIYIYIYIHVSFQVSVNQLFTGTPSEHNVKYKMTISFHTIIFMFSPTTVRRGVSQEKKVWGVLNCPELSLLAQWTLGILPNFNHRWQFRDYPATSFELRSDIWLQALIWRAKSLIPATVPHPFNVKIWQERLQGFIWINALQFPWPWREASPFEFQRLPHFLHGNRRRGGRHRLPFKVNICRRRPIRSGLSQDQSVLWISITLRAHDRGQLQRFWGKCLEAINGLEQRSFQALSWHASMDPKTNLGAKQV